MTEIVACFFFSKNGWCSNSGEKPTFWMLTFKATVPSPYLKDWWNTIFVLFSHLALCQTKQSLVNINKKWEEKEAEKTKRPDLLLNVSEQENQVSNHWTVTIGLLPLDCNHGKEKELFHYIQTLTGIKVGIFHFFAQLWIFNFGW